MARYQAKIKCRWLTDQTSFVLQQGHILTGTILAQYTTYACPAGMHVPRLEVRYLLRMEDGSEQLFDVELVAPNDMTVDYID